MEITLLYLEPAIGIKCLCERNDKSNENLLLIKAILRDHMVKAPSISIKFEISGILVEFKEIFSYLLIEV